MLQISVSSVHYNDEAGYETLEKSFRSGFSVLSKIKNGMGPGSGSLARKSSGFKFCSAKVHRFFRFGFEIFSNKNHIFYHFVRNMNFMTTFSVGCIKCRKYRI